MISTSPTSAGAQAGARMPVIFAAHGAPVLLDDAGWMAELAAWASAMPRPESMAYAFRPGIPAWARDFDGWAADTLGRFDVDALMDFQNRAPAARTALPTWEHYAPVLIAAGAVADEQPRASFPITGFWMDGAFTKRSVQLG